jgi:hypothetical protein
MYSEEQQKLDLMMKIQQARQRQALQRKLLQRRQGGGGGGGGGGRGGGHGHGHGPSMGKDVVRGLGPVRDHPLS